MNIASYWECGSYLIPQNHIHVNFHQEKIFTNFAICSHWRNFYHTNFLSSVNDYIEDKAIFTTLAKICFTEYFCSTKVAGLAKFLSSKNSVVYGIYSTHHISPRLHAIITVVSNFTREPTS